MVKVWVAAVDVLMLVLLSSPRGGVTSGGGARRRAEGDVAIGFEVIVVIDGIEAIDIPTMKWMIDAIQ